MKSIDLTPYCTSDALAVSGREKGVDLREQLKIDEIENEGGGIQITIPDRIISLNSSFFLGLFGPSVARLGASEFRKRFVFKGNQAINEDIDDGIRQALKKSNPLA